MKKYSLLGLVLILFTGFLYNISAQATKNVDIQGLQEEMLLLEAVEAGGFQMEEFNINISTFIPDTFLTMEEIKSKQKDIMQILNIDEKVTIIDMSNMHDSQHQSDFEELLDTEEEIILEQKTEDEGYNEVITFIPSEDGNMTVIKLLSNQIEEQPETHIIVDIVQNKGYKGIVGISNQVQKFMEKYQNKVEITINLTGVQSGKLNKAEEKQKQEDILNFLKAKETEVLEDEFFTSITAYSPLISSYITYGGKDVNIQLAMRYSEYEDKTYLWIATPLITIAY